MEGEARLLYLAWRYGGADPFRTYHGLAPNYVPFLELADEEPRPRLPLPFRQRMFLYGMSIQANEEAQKLAGATRQTR